MTTHYYETQEVTLTALLVEGQAESGTVTFTFYVDGEQHGEPVEKQLEESARSVSCDFTCPEVPADQVSYALACEAEADQELIRRFDDMRVWPRKVKVTTVDAVSGDPVTGVTLRVMQNQQQVGPDAQTFGQDGSAELGLNRGHPFTVEVRPPYQLHQPIAGGTLRDLTAQVGLDFTAEFVAPVRPHNGQIRQLVNLATANEGRDGQGHQVCLQVGVAGDRDGTNDPTIGDLGVKIYVKVEFGPDPGKSRRNDPITQLEQGLLIEDWTEVTAGEEYTATVTTNLVDGTQEFTVELGLAGGDTCTVSIGHDDTCGDASVTFTNWRRLYYEILAPDFMPLDNCQLPDGNQGNDLPQAIRDEVKTLADSIFLELVVIKSHLFAQNWTNYPGILPRSFLERGGGPVNVYCMDTVPILKPAAPFDKTEDERSFYVHLCDRLFKNTTENPAQHVTFTDDAAALQIDLGLPRQRWWPLLQGTHVLATANRAAISSLRWRAAVPAGTYTRQPLLHFAGTVHQPDPRTSIRTKYVQIQETVQGVNLDVTFTTTFGTVTTDLSDNQQTAIDNLIRQVSTAGTQQLSFRLVGETDSDRRRDRMTSVLNGLTDAYTRLKICTLDLHPGCDPLNGGQPRQGDASGFLDLARSTEKKIALTLPNALATDPGSFVGAAVTDTECPVTITAKVARIMPLGGTSLNRVDVANTPQADLGGAIVLVVDGDNPRHTAHSFVHEVCHHLDMTVYDGAPDAHAPGFSRSKRIDEQETNPEYQHNGQLGHVYEAHGHTGPHCAWGLSDLQKGQGNYDAFTAQARCILFGIAPPRDVDMGNFQGLCRQCKDYLNARNLVDLGDPTVIP